MNFTYGHGCILNETHRIVTKTGSKKAKFFTVFLTTICGSASLTRLAAWSAVPPLLICNQARGGHMSMTDWLQIVRGFRYCMRWGIMFFTRIFGSTMPKVPKGRYNL
jgi:hypothetical protein